MPPLVGVCFYGSAVNAGVPRAARMLQRLLRVGVDGIVGRNTLAVAVSCNQRELASFMLLDASSGTAALRHKSRSPPYSCAAGSTVPLIAGRWSNSWRRGGGLRNESAGGVGRGTVPLCHWAWCVYVLTLRTERDTARMEAQEARQDAATWKAAAQSGEAAVRELAAVKATAEVRRRNGTPQSRRSRGTGTNSGANCGRQCGMTKRLAIGVLLLSLPLFSGCSGRREVAAVPLVIREEVPALSD